MASTAAGLPRLDPPPGRLRELEDPLNAFVYHPLSRRIAGWLYPTFISPNAVSLAGMLLVWAAAAAYTGLAWPLSFAAGFTLHLLWHIVDGADGDLARLRGTSSPSGELIDGLCDYGGHVVLYVALAAMLDDSLGGWAWALAIAAGASHMVQTNHAESQRRSYLWWAYGIPWLNQTLGSERDGFSRRGRFRWTVGGLLRTYMWAAKAMNPHGATIDRLVAGAQTHPRRAGRVRRLVRRASRRSLVFQKAVGPNPRTIILGASMAAGSPLHYFLAELVLLNLLLAASIWHHNRVGRRLSGKLGRLAG